MGVVDGAGAVVWVGEGTAVVAAGVVDGMVVGVVVAVADGVDVGGTLLVAAGEVVVVGGTLTVVAGDPPHAASAVSTPMASKTPRYLRA
jgi:hypothetical protein